MAVVGILIAILLPSLSSVRETAHQVVCRSNVRQLAIGIAMYADANTDSMPRTATIASTQTFETLTLRFGAEWPNYAGVSWDGLGLLFRNEYTAAPKVFYCPSHRGAHPYRQFADAWSTDGVTIAGNFQYRGRAPTGKYAPGGQQVLDIRLNKILPTSSIVADGLRNQSEFNHRIGTNVMRADISVSWFNDSSGTVSDALAQDDQTPTESQIQHVWNALDGPIVH